MKNPHDGYWHLGSAICKRFQGVDRRIIGQHLLGWTVKLYYLPLMFVPYHGNINHLINVDLTHVFSDFKIFYDLTYHTIFTIDLLFVVIGYMLTVRLFDNHIRSTEPTFLGWAVALECYQPFWSFFSTNYFAYNSGLVWGEWLQGSPLLYALWGSAILFLLGIYLYATIPFGIRFSNLTNRGILTNGPYYYSKHPAYVSKNISWWLISIPFIKTKAGRLESLRHCLMLLCVNLIYFLRARTEERHLSQDPDYVQYAQWMERNGLFRFVGKWIPLLRFKKGQLFNITD
jgi:protein-S-isoprenylcysteine O-methyltransferase Ste14